MKPNFEILLLKEAIDFLELLDDKAREKVYYNMKKSQFIRDHELLKKLNQDIWEFRSKYQGKTIRLLAFWDKTNVTNTLVIATNGFIKKSQKTPINEIEKAIKIRVAYFEYKKKANRNFES